VEGVKIINRSNEHKKQMRQRGVRGVRGVRVRKRAKESITIDRREEEEGDCPTEQVPRHSDEQGHSRVPHEEEQE
jgi:hypothetical protein